MALRGIQNTQNACPGGQCSGCRGAACQACKNCPNCPSCRDGAKGTASELNRMKQADPVGTQNGVNDAFKQNPDLDQNLVLAKILAAVGLENPQQNA